MPFRLSRILIVDDVKANARLLAKRLSDEYECFTASNGEEALTTAFSQRPDLILLDILMPDMDGFEVCRLLKNDDRTRIIPIIFITSLNEDEDEAKGLACGAVDYIRKPFRMPIVKARIKNHIELKMARDILERQAFIDGLTTIPNRRRFDDVLNKEWHRAVRTGSPLSLILMDIDCFKNFNDNYGHQKGDSCLRKIGIALRDTLKRGSDFVARYGGEEFAAILPHTDAQGALAIAHQIKTAVSNLGIPHAYSSAAPHVTISLGAATLLPTKNQNAIDIVRAADDALYQAKNKGRNNVEISG